MTIETILDSNLFKWVILPFLIFLARICDQSIGTIRILLLQRGHKLWAPLLGFFEVTIWLLAIRQIMQNLDNWVCYIAYGSGFAMGNFIGMLLEEKLAFGKLVLRIITTSHTADLVNQMRKAGYGVTQLDAKGKRGKVDLILAVIERKDLPAVSELIESHQPDAFYSIEDTRMVNAGTFPNSEAAHASKPSAASPKVIRRGRPFWKSVFFRVLR
jgi:uncharacterized protein YebE (UPF0316 family)